MLNPKHAISLEHGEELSDDSWEIARIWVTDRGPSHVWIAADALDGAYNFGRLMADTIRHGALAYATTYDLDEQEALQDIVNGVRDELREQFEKITVIRPGSLHS